MPRECWAELGWSYRPGQFDGVSARTLMLAGSDTPPDLRRATDAAAAVGSPPIQELQGHAHLAHRTDPAMVADVVCDFLAT